MDFLLNFTKGREPWTLKRQVPDRETTLPISEAKPIEYPPKDGKYSFDLLTNLARSGTDHDHDQPSHLKIVPGLEDWMEKSYKVYGAPEDRFCPAGVYEHTVDEKTGMLHGRPFLG
jgi:electron-transferring-flavoprotein dehydrogenase